MTPNEASLSALGSGAGVCQAWTLSWVGSAAGSVPSTHLFSTRRLNCLCRPRLLALTVWVACPDSISTCLRLDSSPTPPALGHSPAVSGQATPAPQGALCTLHPHSPSPGFLRSPPHVRGFTLNPTPGLSPPSCASHQCRRAIFHMGCHLTHGTNPHLAETLNPCMTYSDQPLFLFSSHHMGRVLKYARITGPGHWWHDGQILSQSQMAGTHLP